MSTAFMTESDHKTRAVQPRSAQTPLPLRSAAPRELETAAPSRPGLGLDLSSLAVNRLEATPARQPSMQSCPLSLGSPRTCPFGGACHTCPARVQKKLTVNRPGDVFEQEADRVAGQVMNTPAAPQPQAQPQAAPQIQRRCATCTEKDKELQRRTSEDHPEEHMQSEVPAIVAEVLRTPGQALDTAARSFMEPRFQRDLSQVRVHTDSRAAESATAVNAQAYTFGHQIVFGSGRYSPGTTEGRGLLAHELVHVEQQRGSTASPTTPKTIGATSDHAEHQAHQIGAQISAGGHTGAVQAETAPAALRRLPFGITLPSGLRRLTPAEESMARSVYGGSLDFSRVLLSDAVGGGGRPYTVYVPNPLPGVAGSTIINIGPSAYASPGSNRNLLIHELAHSWQSQHHPFGAQFMANSVASQTAAAAAGGDSYCFIPGKPFGSYGAEQIANQVEKGVSAIVSHVASVSAGAIDPSNILSLSVPRWEKPGATGVVC